MATHFSTLSDTAVLHDHLIPRTPNDMAYVETGRFPLCVHSYTTFIKQRLQNGCPSQASYQAGTKWPMNQRKKKKKKKRILGEKEGEKREKTTTTLSETKEEASNVSEQQDKDWIHVIRVHDTNHLAVTTTRQGNRRSRTTPHKERMRGLVKHRDYPPPPSLTRAS